MFTSIETDFWKKYAIFVDSASKTQTMRFALRRKATLHLKFNEPLVELILLRLYDFMLFSNEVTDDIVCQQFIDRVVSIYTPVNHTIELPL